MQSIETSALGAGAGGLLSVIRPAAQLRRLRAVRLGAALTRLTNLRREARALELFERHFPGLVEGQVGDGWYGMLADFLKLVQAEGWFEVDWPTLDYLHDYYMQVGDSEVEYLDAEAWPLFMMGEYLTGIPVRHYNFGDEEWLNDVPERFQILAIIRGLVDPAYNPPGWANTLIEFEIYDALAEFDLADIEANLERISPGTHHEPLCWLPEVVQYCRQRCGNPLLDTSPDYLDLNPTAWLWDEDLEAVKVLYRQAQPVWARIEAFLNWCDDETAVRAAVETLLDPASAPLWARRDIG